MKRKIKLHNRIVNYSIRRSRRARRMRLAVYCNGNFVVTVPVGLHESSIEHYIFQKSKWVLTKLDFFARSSLSKTERLTVKDYKKYKDKALQIAIDRVNYFNKRIGYTFNKITIKNQKTRWGSCSRKRNLNFNFKIVLLQPAIRDYIIVHELCHLKVFNHSKKYWNSVEQLLPDYKELMKKLRIHGLQLM